MTRRTNRAVAPARVALRAAPTGSAPAPMSPPTLPPTGRWSGVWRGASRHGIVLAVALGTVYLVWGSTFLAIRITMDTIPPFLMMSIRFAVAGSVLFLWAVRRGDRRRDRITLRQVGQAVITAGLLLVGGTGLVTLSQTGISSGMAALLTATVPFWMALLGRGALGDRLSRRAWLGLLVGLAGIAILVDPSGGGQLAAVLLALLGAAAWAAGSLWSRVADAPRRPMVAASIQMLAASVMFALLAVAMGEPARFDLRGITPASWWALAYLIVAGSLVAFTAYAWLLRNTSTQLVSTHAYVNPVVAVALGWAFAGETVTGRTLVAGAIVMLSVVLLVTGRPGVPVPAQATSGANVFAGVSRWHRIRRRIGGLPRAARLFRDPGAPHYRQVGPRLAADDDLLEGQRT